MDLSTELSTVDAIIGLVIVLQCAVLAVFLRLLLSARRVAASALQYAREAVEFTQEENAQSWSRKTLAELSGEMTGLKDAYESLIKQHKRLRARVGMRENRAKKAAAENGELSPATTRDKDQLRLFAKSHNLLK